MKIKKYTAASMREALIQIKKELGPEAVILKTRTIEGKGLLKKNEIEVTAALDIENEAFISPDSLNSIEKKEKDFRADFIPSMEEIPQDTAIKDIPDESDLIQFQFHPHPVIRYYQKQLYKQEIKFQYISKLTKNILNKFNDFMDTPEIEQLFRQEIIKKIPTSGQLMLKRNQPTIIALIGPTGVGKTTTIAKLATNFTLFGKLKVALITADTYRVAAVEQLKTFAKIINIPLEVVYNPEEIPKFIEEFQDMNLIFIDTAGRSQKNKEQIEELKKYLDYGKPDETHLVLSATTKSADNIDVVKKFSITPINRLIFTKLDETDYYGSIYNILQQLPKKISYFTNGQNVPEDIGLADPNFLVDYLIGETHV